MNALGIMAPYIDDFEIECPIEIVLDRGRVASMHDPVEGVNKIRLPLKIREADLGEYNPDRPYLASFVHELGHLHLAEQIDPSFAGFDFDGDEVAKQMFSTVENLLVDAWVDDLFHSRFPDLFEAHHRGFTNQTLGFIAAKQWKPMLPSLTPYTLGATEAFAQRYGIEEVDFRAALTKAGFDKKLLSSKTGSSLHGVVDSDVYQKCATKPLDRTWDYIRGRDGEPDPRTLDDIGTLAKGFSEVPGMTYDRSEALKLHEDEANRLLLIARMGMVVSLVDEGSRPHWEVAA